MYETKKYTQYKSIKNTKTIKWFKIITKKLIDLLYK